MVDLKDIQLVPEISDRQLKWRNEVWPTCRQNHILDATTQSEWLLKIRQDPTMCFFGLFSKGENAIVGTAGLTSISRHHRTAEFSLLIGPEYQGKGYSKPSLVRLLEYGFLRLDLEVIYGEVIHNNEKAMNCYKALGFYQEGILRSRYFKMGQRYDSTVFSMSRKEFNIHHSNE